MHYYYIYVDLPKNDLIGFNDNSGNSMSCYQFIIFLISFCCNLLSYSVSWSSNNACYYILLAAYSCKNDAPLTSMNLKNNDII